MIIRAHKVSRGNAAGEAIVTGQAISFLGSVDPRSGIIVERGHELEGKCIKDRVLVFPEGKGSTVGSYVIYQLKKNNVAPAAMINVASEPIVAVGAIISEIPLVDRLEKNPLVAIKTGDIVRVDADAGLVEVGEVG